MWKIVLSGLALFAAGWVKQAEHLAELGRRATLEGFLALKCGGDAAASSITGIESVSAFHCWGCYAMAAGAAMIALAGYAAITARRARLAEREAGRH